MLKKICTEPNLALTSPKHSIAIEKGSEHFFTSWTYNVEDRFKGLPNEDIRSELRKTAFPFAVCFEHWTGDFNTASGIRNANAFNAIEVLYVGRRKIDRRGCCGVQNYTDIKFIPTIEEFISYKSKYTFVGVDNIEGAIPINNYKYPTKPLLIFGEESCGLTIEMRKLCDELIYIKQFGSVRSLNAATASGIIMNDFVSKLNKINDLSS